MKINPFNCCVTKTKNRVVPTEHTIKQEAMKMINESLLKAVRANDIERVKITLDKGASVRYRGEDWNNAIDIVTEKGTKELRNLILFQSMKDRRVENALVRSFGI